MNAESRRRPVTPLCAEKRTDRSAPRGPEEPWGDLCGWICQFKLKSGEFLAMYVWEVLDDRVGNGVGKAVMRADVVTVQRFARDNG